MTFDRIDIALLAALCDDARASHVELAERVGLSSTAVARRQKQLEEQGFITGYQAALGLRKLGFATTVSVRITLDSQSEAALDAFEKAVKRCTSVVHCLLMSGSDDYLLTVLARDIEDFERIHKTQLSMLPRVARIQSSFALREVVDRGAPPAVIERLRKEGT
jgi:Lrp/AsnC family leucine-responsive transcriptional regulator